MHNEGTSDLNIFNIIRKKYAFKQRCAIVCCLYLTLFIAGLLVCIYLYTCILTTHVQVLLFCFLPCMRQKLVKSVKSSTLIFEHFKILACILKDCVEKLDGMLKGEDF